MIKDICIHLREAIYTALLQKIFCHKFYRVNKGLGHKGSYWDNRNIPNQIIKTRPGADCGSERERLNANAGLNRRNQGKPLGYSGMT